MDLFPAARVRRVSHPGREETIYGDGVDICQATHPRSIHSPLKGEEKGFYEREGTN